MITNTSEELLSHAADTIEALLPNLAEGLSVESLLLILREKAPKPVPSPRFYMKTEAVDKLELTYGGRGIRVPFRSHSKQENELLENIRERGIQTPLTLRREQNGDLLLHDGLSRLLIAKELKIEYLPVIVHIDMPALLSVIL
jgi:hypothetical protein